MKKAFFTMLFAAAGLLVTGSSYAQYSNCADSNSKACVDARNAFAEHHGGAFPEQYYNSWYAGNQGRWNQENNDWRWEGVNGDEYGKGDRGWEWKHHHDHN